MARKERCNDFSIGIELEGTDDLPYDETQYDALARLTSLLEKHYPIIDRVGHSDIAPTRKTDPGSAFDWRRYKQSVAAIEFLNESIVCSPPQTQR